MQGFGACGCWGGGLVGNISLDYMLAMAAVPYSFGYLPFPPGVTDISSTSFTEWQGQFSGYSVPNMVYLAVSETFSLNGNQLAADQYGFDRLGNPFPSGTRPVLQAITNANIPSGSPNSIVGQGNTITSTWTNGGDTWVWVQNLITPYSLADAGAWANSLLAGLQYNGVYGGVRLCYAYQTGQYPGQRTTRSVLITLNSAGQTNYTYDYLPVGEGVEYPGSAFNGEPWFQIGSSAVVLSAKSATMHNFTYLSRKSAQWTAAAPGSTFGYYNGLIGTVVNLPTQPANVVADETLLDPTDAPVSGHIVLSQSAASGL